MPKAATDKDIRYRKRLAVQLAAQLPEDHEAAIAIMDYVRELYSNFLAPEAEPERRGANLQVVDGKLGQAR